MSSILSFPERGPWGNARYRGNCSGHVYRALFEMLRPRSFCDPMAGSGTSVEVARELGILAHGLDLRMGFNALRHSILATIGGEPVDACISHVPYGVMECVNGIFEIFPKKNCSNTSTMGYSGVLNVEWIALL